MKALVKNPIVTTSLNANTRPDTEDIGFVCTPPMTREEWMHQRSMANLNETARRGVVLTAMGAAGYLAVKGLTFLGDRTGKRSFYAAGALLGAACSIGGVYAVNRHIDYAFEREDSIRAAGAGMPDLIRDWVQMSSEEVMVIRAKYSDLEYDREKDGVMTVDELILKRAGQVVDLLAEANVEDVTIDDIVELLQNEQYEAVQIMVDAAHQVLDRDERISKLTATEDDVVEGYEPQVEGRDLPKARESGDGLMEDPVV